jgi:hypothetical protein
LISLDIPSEQERAYVIISGFMIGPFAQDLIPSQSSSYRSMYDYLVQGSAFYNEKPVENFQVNAELKFNPACSRDILPAPVGVETNRFIWTASMYGYPGTKYSNVVRGGLAYSGASWWSKDSVTTTYYAITGDPHDFTIYTMAGQAQVSKAVFTFKMERYTLTKLQKAVATYSRMTANGPGKVVSFDGTTPKSADFIITTVHDNTGMYGSASSVSFTPYQPYTVVVASPSAIKSDLNVHLVNRMFGTSPLIPKDFGDIAMEAVDHVQTNHVNMLGLLRDLRHPTEMIPKLAQLRNLKGLANNYLAVKYGILPTIDDLKSIWEAFERTMPYIDRNGFSTYGARHLDIASANGIAYALEQHVKLAIADEDSKFIALLNAMDKIGFFPTLETVWDLIPYTFVVDWFVTAGDLLHRIDTYMRLDRYDVRYATTSIKEVATMGITPSDITGVTGTVEVVRYQRWVSDQCPAPRLSLQSTFQDFDHWLESGALIVQRTKH